MCIYTFTCPPQVYMLTTGKEWELEGMGHPEVIVRHHGSSGDVVQHISEPCPQRHRVWVGDRACISIH